MLIGVGKLLYQVVVLIVFEGALAIWARTIILEIEVASFLQQSKKKLC